MRPKRNHANSVANNKIGFTVEYWTAHKTCGKHMQQLVLKEEAKRLDARTKTNDPKLLEKVRRAHKANARNQVGAELD